jgi:8-oxo-dGTP pyrophosphatase MutT (NUDIX family)
MIESDSNRPAAEPRDAATVVLLRDEAEGFSVFMVRRHQKSGFMAGAYVFPGGTLDEADRDPRLLAKTSGRSAEEAARVLGEEDAQRALGLHVAALRETFEEAGVLLADALGGIALAPLRERLHGGEAFSTLLEELGVSLRADALTPWARWITPAVERRRYDARFFIARAPESQEAAHDRIEVTAGEWLTPAGALARWEAGEIQLPPPTLRTLEQLRAYDTIDAVLTEARARTPRVVMPVFRQMGDVWALILPGDPEHPESERAIEGPTRFVLVDGVFRSMDP